MSLECQVGGIRKEIEEKSSFEFLNWVPTTYLYISKDFLAVAAAAAAFFVRLRAETAFKKQCIFF